MTRTIENTIMALVSSLHGVGLSSALASQRTDRYEIVVDERDGHGAESIEGATVEDVVACAQQIQAEHALSDDDIIAIEDDAAYEEAVRNAEIGNKILQGVDDWAAFLKHEEEWQDIDTSEVDDELGSYYSTAAVEYEAYEC